MSETTGPLYLIRINKIHDDDKEFEAFVLANKAHEARDLLADYLKDPTVKRTSEYRAAMLLEVPNEKNPRVLATTHAENLDDIALDELLAGRPIAEVEQYAKERREAETRAFNEKADLAIFIKDVMEATTTAPGDSPANAVAKALYAVGVRLPQEQT